MRKIIRGIQKVNSKVKVGLLTAGVVCASAVPAFAEGVANASVQTAFTGLKDDVIATLGVVAGLAVAVMAIFLAWKYGRKIFSQVAK